MTNPYRLNRLALPYRFVLLVLLCMAIPAGLTWAAPRAVFKSGPLNTLATTNFALSDLGTTVVYAAAEPVNPNSLVQYDGLYAVPVTGGTPTKLDARIGTGGNNVFLVASDDQSVLFLGTPLNPTPSQTWGIWKAATTGGAAVKVMDFEANASVALERGFWAISPNGAQVVIRYMVSNESRLRSAPMNGSNPAGVRLDDHTATTGRIQDFRISSNSARVAFVRGDATPFHLYSVPIAGPSTSVVKLTTTGTFSQLDLAGAEFAEHGARLVFVDGVDLWSANVDGSDAVQLAAGPSGGFGGAGGVVVNAAQDQILFYVGGVYYTIGVHGPGSAVVPLTSSLPSMASAAFAGLGGRAVFAGATQIYSIPLSGPTSVPAPLTAGSGLYTAEGVDRFVFQSDTEFALKSARATGTADDVVNLTPVLTSDWVQLDFLHPIDSFSQVRISPNGEYLAYRNLNGLFLVPLGGPVSATRVIAQEPQTGANSSIVQWLITGDSRRVVYRYNANLYVVELFPGCAATVSTTPGPGVTPAPGLTPVLYLPSVRRCG